MGSCDALVAVVGKGWATITDETGKKRLDDPLDFVRLEVSTALKRKIRVIPVLVRGARMPRADDLPDELKSFIRRNALELSHVRYQADVDKLITTLEKLSSRAETEETLSAEIPAQIAERESHDVIAPARSNSREAAPTEPPDQITAFLASPRAELLKGRDVFDDDFYSKPESTKKNPVCESGSGDRVVRGGSWFNDAGYCRSAFRYRSHPSFRDYDLGFRPSRPLP